MNTSINLFLNVINTTLNNHAPIEIKPKLTLLLLTNHGSPMQLENLSLLKIGSTNSFIKKRINLKRKKSLSTLNLQKPPIFRMSKEDYFKIYFDDRKTDTDQSRYCQT